MPSRRAKTAEAVREIVSMAIIAELRDPRVQNVTVTYVEVSDDLRNAKVHVSVMGEQKRQDLALHGLQNAAGFLQAKIAAGVEMGYTPRLVFVLDQGVKQSIEIAKILNRVLPPDDPPPDAEDVEDVDDAEMEESQERGEDLPESETPPRPFPPSQRP